MLRRLRHARVLVLVLGLILLTAGCAYKPPENLTPDQKMLVLTKPAVVRPVTDITVQFAFSARSSVASVLGSNPYEMSFSVTGSGWFISPDGYIVTNAHVAEDAHSSDKDLALQLLPYLYRAVARKLRPAQDTLNNSQQQIVLNDLVDYKVSKAFYVVTPGGEVLPAEIKAFGVPIGEDISGKDVAILKVEGKNFPTLTAGNSDSVKDADKIYILGYPGAADVEGLFDKKSILESSTSEGAVQARKNTAQGTPVIQIGGAANPGNSGGPVVNQKGEVIGILTFGKTEGVNFAVPMNTIMEFVRQAGANPGNSDTNTRFKEAMDLYWSGHFTQSIEKFNEVQRLYPAHSLAKKYISEAEGHKKDEPFMDPKLMWILLAAAAVVIGGAVAAVVVLGRKRQGAVAPVAAAAAPRPVATYPAAPAAPVQAPAASLMPQASVMPVTPPSLAPQAPAMPVSPPSLTPQVPAMPVTPPSLTPQVPTAAPAMPAGTTVLPAHLGYASFLNGPLAGQRIAIPATGCFVGREPGEGGLMVPDNRVSRQHCWIGPDAAGRTVLVDRGSTNGTYIGSIAAGRVSQAELHPGSEVHLGGEGGIVFRFEV